MWYRLVVCAGTTRQPFLLTKYIALSLMFGMLSKINCNLTELASYASCKL